MRYHCSPGSLDMNFNPYEIGIYGGNLFDPVNPDPKDIRLSDIARSLSRICRFNGHTNIFYSVLQHSFYVARFLPERLSVFGLLHDAHEAYIGDISTPMKNYIGRDRIEKLTTAIDQAIYRAVGIRSPTEKEMEMVRRADWLALQIETSRLFSPKAPWLSPEFIDGNFFSPLPAGKEFSREHWIRSVRSKSLEVLEKSTPDFSRNKRR